MKRLESFFEKEEDGKVESPAVVLVSVLESVGNEFLSALEKLSRPAGVVCVVGDLSEGERSTSASRSDWFSSSLSPVPEYSFIVSVESPSLGRCQICALAAWLPIRSWSINPSDIKSTGPDGGPKSGQLLRDSKVDIKQVVV